MKRSEINNAINNATAFFNKNCWSYPSDIKWDVTDFGLGKFEEYGLVLINLTEEPEYCEKLMYATLFQKTPAHYHKLKKEDIICRTGKLAVQLWAKNDKEPGNGFFEQKVNGKPINIKSGEVITLNPGDRITITQGIWHQFWAETKECIIGEVSTANDDINDNFFANPEIGRFSEVEEDVNTIK